MIIETAFNSEEDLETLSNTLNAQACRFLNSDRFLYYTILRAQAAIDALTIMLDKEPKIKKGET